jgi:serine/threonine-protein kinase RsbW
MFHSIFPADALTVREALVFLRARFEGHAGADTISHLELALAEVLNNICQHGVRSRNQPTDNPARSPIVHLCVIRHVGGIACAITDNGSALPPACLGPRELPQFRAEDGQPKETECLPEGGFGWFLIQELAASLSYFREGQRNFLGFIIPITDQPETMTQS